MLLKGDNLILVIGNVVSKEIKANCFEVYGIHIWDVKNLLWLFEEFSDIKNEFISLLTYSIDDLQLEIPEPQLFEEKQIEKRERTWVSAKYCYAAHESRLHQNDRCKRFALCLVLTVRFRSLAPWGKLFQLFI